MDEEIQSLVTAKEGDHMVVDVVGLVKSMKEALDSISESPSPPHICRVPEHIRKDNHVYYIPKIVSIGPIHRRTRNLWAMEEHKWRYLQKVMLSGSEPYEVLLERCVEGMKKLMAEGVRKCYSRNTLNLDEEEFVKMMLLDGCFLIQILLSQNPSEKNDPIVNKNDPIVNTQWMLPLIAHDMLLLENQLPFAVLESLANLIGEDPCTLKEKAIEFLFSVLPVNFTPSTKNESPPQHLLHLVHLSLKPASSITVQRQETEAVRSSIPVQPQETEAVGSSITQKPFLQFFLRVICLADTKNKSSSQVPTATGLEEAGVVFKINKGGSFSDVTFENGVMRLPRLTITDDTNSLFRNIIAFEQCFSDRGLDFTNYCIFMDSLVNTPRDVQILKQSDIIENMLGSDEEVALLFNQLCKEIVGDFGIGSVGKAREAANHYAGRRWPKWRARLIHDYFSHPWAIISLIAAVYVIFLTSVQTYFAAF